MLIFNRLLPMFVLPLGWVFLLLGYGIWRRKRWPAVVAMTLLYVASTRYMAGLVLGGLEARSRPMAVVEAPPADAVVVLGGIFGPPVPDGQVPNVADSSERLEAGIALLNQGRAPMLVFTGGRLPWNESAEMEGERAKRFVVARGIPSEKILVTGLVRNTADEALAVAEMMQRQRWNRIILVTTAWHMPRAARLFRRAGIDIVPFPVDYRLGATGSWHLLDFVPSGEALEQTEQGLREVYGILFYAVTGR
jgi:uncharacterized SAM-binding protein YcdF (DUF218 family)